MFCKSVASLSIGLSLAMGSGSALACPPQVLMALAQPVAVQSTQAVATTSTVMMPQTVQSTVMVPQTVQQTVMVPQTVTSVVSTPVVVPAPTVSTISTLATVAAVPVCAKPVGLLGRLFGGRSVSKTTVRTSGFGY